MTPIWAPQHFAPKMVENDKESAWNVKIRFCMVPTRVIFGHLYTLYFNPNITRGRHFIGLYLTTYVYQDIGHLRRGNFYYTRNTNTSVLGDTWTMWKHTYKSSQKKCGEVGPQRPHSCFGISPLMTSWRRKSHWNLWLWCDGKPTLKELAKRTVAKAGRITRSISRLISNVGHRHRPYSN